MCFTASFVPDYYTYEKLCKDSIKLAGGKVLKGEEYFDPNTISLKQVNRICTEALSPILQKRPRYHSSCQNLSRSHSSFVGLYVFEGLSQGHGEFIKMGRTCNLDARLKTYRRNGESIQNLTLYEVISSAR